MYCILSLTEYESIGCFGDTSTRAIATLEGTDSRLNGAYRSRENAITKCAEVAYQRRFDVFALQHGGWCASSTDAADTYDMYGPSTACEDDGKGGPWANEVYAFVQYDLACEHQTLSISCSYGTIQIVSANYGRTDTQTCAESYVPVTDCSAYSSVEKVKEACQNQQQCSVVASNGVFGDPCVGTFKYLKVSFYCKYRGK